MKWFVSPPYGLLDYLCSPHQTGGRNNAAVHLLKILNVTVFPLGWWLLVTKSFQKAATLDVVHIWQFEMRSTLRHRHTFLLFPLLSNLGHILCGRLGHTIPLGFEGIWWTSVPSFNLNIWVTEKWVNTSLCLTFRIFSSCEINYWVLRVSFFPPSSVYSFPSDPLLVCSSRACTHTHTLASIHLPVSHSFKMYIHTELNITFMLLLSVLHSHSLSPSLSHMHPLTMFSSFSFSPLLQCCHRHRFLWQQRG